MLVVGTGQSGAQIAEDLHLAGRQVHLAVGSAPRVARFYRGRDCMTWLADMGLYDKSAPEYPGGKAAIEKTNHYVTGRDGGRDIDLRRFAAEGMQLYGTLGRRQGRDAGASSRRCATALDKADAVYNSICADIDAHIEREGIHGAGSHPVRPGVGTRHRGHRTRPGRRGRHQHRLGDRLPARLPLDRGERLRRRRPAHAEPRRHQRRGSDASSGCRGCTPGAPAGSSASTATPATSPTTIIDELSVAQSRTATSPSAR